MSISSLKSISGRLRIPSKPSSKMDLEIIYPLKTIGSRNRVIGFLKPCKYIACLNYGVRS